MPSFSDIQADIRFLSRLARVTDGAIVGVALAYAAVRTWLCYNFTSSALLKIRESPSVDISDLRSLLSSETQESSNSKLVVVRGLVEAKSTIVDGEGNSNALVARGSGQKAVLSQNFQTCISCNEKTSVIRILTRAVFQLTDEKIGPLRMVPFVLVKIGQTPSSDYVIVNLDGSKHPLPLETVYRNLQPVQSPESILTFIHMFFGTGHRVGVLDEEKVLSLGKEISAVGIPILQNGIPQIKSCQDLPYFLSEMTKDQMVAGLAIKTEFLYWASLILGSCSVGILGYAIMRNWGRWKLWWQRNQIQQDIDIAYQSDEETEEIPDEESCVICLTRRRRFAFLPCGHLVSCRGCAISVERQSEPKCPVCRQTVRTSHQIFAA